MGGRVGCGPGVGHGPRAAGAPGEPMEHHSLCLLPVPLRRCLAPLPRCCSRCLLNGSPTSLRVLREVGRLLVDVNGQHAALSLRDSNTQVGWGSVVGW